MSFCQFKVCTMQLLSVVVGFLSSKYFGQTAIYTTTVDCWTNVYEINNPVHVFWQANEVLVGKLWLVCYLLHSPVD